MKNWKAKIRIQRVGKTCNAPSLKDLLLIGVKQFIGPMMLASGYYVFLWIGLIIFEWSEITELLNMILEWKVIWLRLGVCSIKIFVSVILITLVYRRFFTLKSSEEALFSRIEKVGEIVLEICTIVGLVYAGFSTSNAINAEPVLSSTDLGLEIRFNQIYFSFACTLLLGKASRRILRGVNSVRRCRTQEFETEGQSFFVEVSREAEQRDCDGN